MVGYDIEGEFRRWQSANPNFITPRLLKIRPVDKYVIELSKGEGMKHEPIYGVSLLEREDYGKFKNIGWRANVSGAFDNLKEANRHVERLVDVVESCQLYSDDEDKFIDCLKRKM